MLTKIKSRKKFLISLVIVLLALVGFVSQTNAHGLRIIDVSDPNLNPEDLKGFSETPVRAQAIHIIGNYAYLSLYDEDGVTGDWGGLWIINVSDSNNPFFEGFYQSLLDFPFVGQNAYCWDVFALDNNIAYLAAGGVLDIVDVSIPDNPSLVPGGRYKHPAGSLIRGVYVVGTKAYLADAHNGLLVVDVFDPASPSLLGEWNGDPNWKPLNVFIRDDKAYVTSCHDDMDERLYIFDVSLDVPVFLGKFDTTFTTYGYAYHVRVEENVMGDDIAYLADGSLQLNIIDVSNPSNPISELLSPPYGTGDAVNDIYIENNKCYIANGNSFQILDVIQPDSPAPLGSLDFSLGWGLNVNVLNNKAYVVNAGPSILDYIDIKAYDKNNNLIANGPDGISGTADDNTVYDLDTDKVKLESTAADTAGVLNHKVKTQLNTGGWVTIFNCWDTDSNGYCDCTDTAPLDGECDENPTINVGDFLFDIDIGNLESDSQGAIDQLAIGPFSVGDVVDYKSEATDNFFNTGYDPADCMSEYSFTVVANPNNPPEAKDLSHGDSDYCSLAPTGLEIFSWTYSDDDGDPQKRFDFRINNVDNVNDPNPEVDRRFCDSEANSQIHDVITALLSNSHTYCIGTPDEYTVSTPDAITYNTRYYWWVRVWDNKGADSDWVSGGFFDTELHPYPVSSFTCNGGDCSSIAPLIGDDVDFLNDPGSFGPYTWDWDFGDDSPPPPDIPNPTHSYAIESNFNIILNVTDSSFSTRTCSHSEIVTVGKKMPKWWEIRPQ